MKEEKRCLGPYPSAREIAEAEQTLEAHRNLPSALKLSFTDTDYMLSEDLRAVRLMLEYMKPESILRQHQIDQTIVIFGSARIRDHEEAKAELEAAEDALKRDPGNKAKEMAVQGALGLYRKSDYYEEARKLGRLIGEDGRFYVATGGGPGIMEAANRGASDAGAENIGFTIAIPKEFPNAYSTPDLTFQFHYFAIRKMHLLMRARALIVFPGGFGTLDELFETLTLMQTYRLEEIPILLFGREYWDRIINFEALVDEGVISPTDLQRFRYVESAQTAWEAIAHL